MGLEVTDCVVVLTTFPLDQDADHFAQALVSQRLAACVNVLAPMRSVYTWKGAIEVADERQLVIKTTRERLPKLQRRMHELHPYEVPEFIVLPVIEGSQKYLDWLSESTTG